MREKIANIRIWLSLALLVMLLDQASKRWVEMLLEPHDRISLSPIFSWVLVYNKGAAFSFLGDASGWQRWLFILLAIGVSLYLLRELWRLRAGQNGLAIAYALILGGAWGNLWDRLTEGKVVDFILLHYQDYYFPAFNIADCAISVGVLVWLWANMKQADSKTDP